MFGYITINKPELKFKEYDIYHSYYCGLCQTLKLKYGQVSRLSLNFDMTFIVMMLSGLYDVETKKESHHCALHPIHKQDMLMNEFSEYAAKMTIVLTYYKCLDDWNDEHKYIQRGYMSILKKSFLKIKEEYPQKLENIEKYLLKVNDYEKNGFSNIEDVVSSFGHVMAEICSYKFDEWYDELYQFGFYLGKFIYFMDAYDDIETDIKKKQFNPLLEKYKEDDFEDYCFQFLELMISKATMIFETLPIIENADILRNILYGGVWTKYVMIKKKRGGKTDESISGSRD